MYLEKDKTMLAMCLPAPPTVLPAAIYIYTKPIPKMNNLQFFWLVEMMSQSSL